VLSSIKCGLYFIVPIPEKPQIKEQLILCGDFLKMQEFIMMEYKGYLGTVEYDGDARIFHGDIINTRDVITFQGTTVNEIEQAFKDSINDYIAWCKEEGVEPEKPYSGKFNVRLSPQLHRQLAILAKKRRVSLNSFVEKAIANEIKLFNQQYTQ
jgi:predicted HicB family RNase H-like nuclease